MTDIIDVEDRERVRYLTINRPEKRNAITLAQMGHLIDLALAAAGDEAVGAVVIRGAGTSFCAGIDIEPKQMDLDYESRTLQKELRLLDPFRKLDDLWRSPVPVIASVHGYCLGVRTDIAFHCDMVLCSSDARFGYPIVRSMASPPTHMWTYLAGPQWAKRMLLTGDNIDGATAARAGFALDCVASEELAIATHQLARKVATIPPDLLAANKSICNKVVEAMGRAMLQELARESNAMAHQSPAAQEFGRIAQLDGLKAALAWQNQHFG